MKTSQRQIFQGGEDTLTCSREDFHASRSALPEREKEQKITATSGRKCYEQYGKYSPLGSLVKMLLVSSRWFSPARRLKWDVQTICSKRISYTERSSNSQSTPSVKTLNVQDIQSNRLLFRLVPSEHPTEEIGYGLLPTIQTQGLKTCENGKSIPMNLALLPTPLSVEVSHAKRITQLKEKGGKTMGSRANGESRPNGLMDYIRFHSLLPTPNAAEGTNWTTKYNPNSQMGQGLTAMAANGLLLSPMSKDGFRAGLTMQALKNHNRPRAKLAEQIAHKVGGGTSQLNPLFVEEMMGYPLEWLTLPFLSQSGEVKVSKR